VPRAPIVLQGDTAEQFGELTAGEPAREIHLEKTVLRVREAGRERKVGAIRSRDGGNAERVALDADRRGDTSRALTVEPRKRGAQQQVNGQPRCNEEQQETDRDASDELQSSATLSISIELVPPSTPDSSPLVRMT
jgi:hypothetical protein